MIPMTRLATTKAAVKAESDKSASPTKKEIGLYLAEAFALDRTEALDEETRGNLKRLLSAAEQRLLVG